MAEQKTPTAKATKTAARAAQPTAQSKTETVAPVQAASPTPSGAGTGTASTRATESTPAPASAPAATPSIEYGKRLGVTLNVAIVATAFHNALASRSVRYVQYALHDRGFEPGNDVGKVDFDTRKAYAAYQKTIDESPTGVPTAYSLNILGFDVS